MISFTLYIHWFLDQTLIIWNNQTKFNQITAACIIYDHMITGYVCDRWLSCNHRCNQGERLPILSHIMHHHSSPPSPSSSPSSSSPSSSLSSSNQSQYASPDIAYIAYTPVSSGILDGKYNVFRVVHTHKFEESENQTAITLNVFDWTDVSKIDNRFEIAPTRIPNPLATNMRAYHKKILFTPPSTI